MDSRSATVLVAALAVVTMVGMAAAANLMVGPSDSGRSSTSTTAVTTLTSTETTTSTVTTTTTTTFTTTTTTTITYPGTGALILRLELNATTVTQGAPIEIDVSDYNPSAAMLNISRGANWSVQGLATGGCPSLYLPLGVAVLKGVYTSSNVSQGERLSIFPLLPCPMIVRLITAYVFLPMSDSAYVLPGDSPQPIAALVPVSGTYGTGGMPDQTAPFVPGQYTVVAGDEWGNLAFAYFTVAAAP
ncbi:MAG TPA: hypothetical protein VMS77_07885 [Conexivisphaerales archaeon]|nr:hypothetical protein [Conexivisphaerales archaeon]